MDYVLSFGLGVISSLHCVGMCGGFAASVALGREVLSYHLRRLAVYAGRGALMGGVGSFVAAAGRLAGWQGLAAILAGVLMLAWAAAYFRGRSLFLPAGFRFGFPLGFGTGRRRAGRRIRVPGALRMAVPGALRIAVPASLRAAGLGALLGFMPCGLLATMEIKAAGTGGVGSGLLVMLAFGVGTVPGLTAWGAAAAAGLSRWRGRLERVGAALVGGAGLLSLLRGLAETGLIPHINPWLW